MDHPPPPPDRLPTTPARRLVTLAAVFLVTFLFLRTFLVEPFGVPTGSMAPTLIGNHRAGRCPRCGYPVRVGLPSAGARAGHFADVPCPNCGKRTDLTDAPPVNGDRLLVDKNVYNVRSPRRWEAAVFRCASDMAKPYVKRVVGLPRERVRILDGDVYADGKLLRKTLAELREVRIPAFDMAFAPKPGGWGPRWLVYPPDRDFRLPFAATGPPPPTADPTILRGDTIVLDAAASSQTEVRLEYRHWNLDALAEEPVLSANSYDGSRRGASNIYPVHDFYLRCEVEVVAGSGSFACRLFDGADSVAAEVPVGPVADGQAVLSHDHHGGLSAAPGVGLKPGKTYTVEFAFADRRATLAIDGKVVLSPADLAAVNKRGEVTRPLQLGARGCHLIVRELKLYRDIHYTQGGKHGTHAPAQLGRDEYFMLGDNSGNSQDSREWPDPGVPEADFIGKPILVHQPLRLGRVSVGGRDRVFQTLDWSRLRWLH